MKVENGLTFLTVHLRQFDNYTEWINQTCYSNDPLFPAIIDKTIGKAVGVSSYLNIKPSIGTIEVGHINFSTELQKTTAATEAMYLISDTAWYSIIDKEWLSLKDAYLHWLNPSNFDENGKQRTRLSELTRPIIELASKKLS